MRFPESQRVLYEKTPLETVICQLRFPPILRIEAEAPYQFQERIRARYPLYKERTMLDASLAVPPDIMKVFGEDLSWAMKSGHKAYDFYSEDETWTISLTKDFIALTGKHYTHWQDFRGRMFEAAGVFVELYRPPHYSRIGLRYRDVINRAKLDLKGIEWSELLTSHVGGELLSQDIGKYVQPVKKELSIQLEAGMGRVYIRQGLIQQPDTDEPCYVIDSDFSRGEKTEVDDAGEVLDYFNGEAGRLFKWCITPRLHHALGPRPI